MIYWIIEKEAGYEKWQVENAISEGRLTDKEYTLIDETIWRQLLMDAERKNVTLVNDPETNMPKLAPEATWQDTLDEWDKLSDDQLKEMLYVSLQYKFSGDDIRQGYDENHPLCLTSKGNVLTCDGARQEYLRYLGDDDIYSQEALDLANKGKAYIRQVVKNYRELP